LAKAKVTRQTRFTVLVATDGSAPARAAVAAAVSFPWPPGVRAHGVVGQGPVQGGLPQAVRDAIQQGLDRIARAARRILARRWPDAEVPVVRLPAAEAVLSETVRRRARVVVLGSRGHSGLSRLFLGSVSLTVARRAPCAVLLVKARSRQPKRLVVGVDGSPASRRAAAFVASLRPPRGGRATVVRVVEPMRLPSLGLLPAGLRSVLGGEAAVLLARQLRDARRDVETLAGLLKRKGWAVRSVVRVGTPQAELLDATKDGRADLLVVGSGSSKGIQRLVLGSVAEGVLRQSAASVLVAR